MGYKTEAKNFKESVLFAYLNFRFLFASTWDMCVTQIMFANTRNMCATSWFDYRYSDSQFVIVINDVPTICLSEHIK